MEMYSSLYRDKNKQILKMIMSEKCFYFNSHMGMIFSKYC